MTERLNDRGTYRDASSLPVTRPSQQPVTMSSLCQQPVTLQWNAKNANTPPGPDTVTGDVLFSPQTSIWEYFPLFLCEGGSQSQNRTRTFLVYTDY